MSVQVFMYHICHCILFGCCCRPASHSFAFLSLSGIAFPMICWQITFRCCSLSPNPNSVSAFPRLSPPPFALAQLTIFQIHFQNKHFTSSAASLLPAPSLSVSPSFDVASVNVCANGCACVCGMCVCVWQVLPTNLKVLLSPSSAPERKWSTRRSISRSSSGSSFSALVHAVSHAAKETQRSAARTTAKTA